jgi:hypothetical protein
MLVDDGAVLHHDHPVGDVEGEAQDLLGHDDGEAARVADRLQRPAHLADDRGLDALGGLVEEQDLRAAGERPRDGELLLLPAREVAAAPSLHLQQDREHVVEILRHLAGAGDRQAGLDVLLHRHGREDHAALRHVGEALGDPGMALEPGHVRALDLDRPGLDRHEAHQGLHQGGLAHAVAAHHGDDLAGRHREGQPVQDLALAVGGVQVLDGERRRGGRDRGEGRRLDSRGARGLERRHRQCPK